MKKYLKTAAWFMGAGLFGGVFYREFSKALGQQNQFSVLGLVHVHFLVLGVIAVLLFGLITDKVNPNKKTADKGLLLYTIGTAGAGILLFVRGIIEMLSKVNGFTVSKSINGAISGVAGLSHIILGVGLIMLFTAWIKACKD